MSADETPNFGTNPCKELLEEMEVEMWKHFTLHYCLGKRTNLDRGGYVAVGRSKDGDPRGGDAILIELVHPENGTTNIAVGEQGAWALFRLLGAIMIDAPPQKIEEAVLQLDAWKPAKAVKSP